MKVPFPPPFVPVRRTAALAMLSALSLIGSAGAEPLNITKTMTVPEMEPVGPSLTLNLLQPDSSAYTYDSVNLDFILPSIRTFGDATSGVEQINVLDVFRHQASLTAAGGMTFAITENTKTTSNASQEDLPLINHTLSLIHVDKGALKVDAGMSDIDLIYAYDTSGGTAEFSNYYLPYARYYINVQENAKLTLSGGNIYLLPASSAGFEDTTYANRGQVIGLLANNSTASLTALTGDNVINLQARTHSSTYAVQSFWGSTVTLAAANANRISLIFDSTGNEPGVAVVALSDSSLTLTAKDNEIYLKQLSSGLAIALAAESGSSIGVTASGGSNTVTAEGYGVLGVRADNGTVSMTSIGGDNFIEVTADGDSPITGTLALSASTVRLAAEDGSNTISLNDNASVNSTAIYASGDSQVTLKAGENNTLEGGDFGIRSYSSEVTLTASGTNSISAADTGILAEASDKADASVAVTGQTVISAETAVSAVGSDAYTASVDINYSGASTVMGNILASDGASVSLASDDDSSTLTLTGYARTGLYSDCTDETPGTIAIDLGSGGYWSMTDSSTVTSLSGTGTVDFASSGTSLAAETLDGEITYAMTLNTDGSGDMLYAVNGTFETQTLAVKNLSSLLSEMSEGDAVRFATVKNAGGGFGEGTEVGSKNAGVYRRALTVDYRNAASDPLNTAAVNAAYNGGDGKPGEEAVEALYGGDGSQNIYLVMTATERPSDIVLAAEKARKVRRRLSTDIDTYVKRRGQIASFDSKKREGGWVRLLGKTADISDVSSMYRAGGEFGFSHEVASSSEHRHRVGIGLGYLRSHGTYSGMNGSWHTDEVTATLYDTAEYQKAEAAADDYRYRDSYVRIHGMHRHGAAVDPLDGTRRTQNAPASAFNVSTELGRSLPIGGGAVLIPQVQLQGSWLSSSTYTDGDGVRVKEPSDWSLIGRLGFDAVKVFDAESESRGWLKASVFHEFHGEEGISAWNEDAKWGEASYREADGSSDTWYTVGAGFSRKIGKSAAVFADIERTAGAGWKHAWEAHLGVHKKF